MKKLISITVPLCFVVFLSCSKSGSPSPEDSLENGLIAHYTFDGNANDYSGNNYNLTVQGATLTNDRHGLSNKAYHFNGIDATMKVPQFPVADSLPAFSVSVWAKPEKGGTVYSLSSNFDKTHQESMGIFNDSIGHNSAINYEVTTFYPNGASHSTYPQDIISDITNRWTHLVLVSDTTGVRSYVNTKAVYHTWETFVVDYSKGGLIGASEIYGPDLYSGDLDDIRFYNRALTEAEIKKLYEQ